MMKSRGVLTFWLVAVALAAGAEAAHQNWQIGPFTRPATGNPVIAPNAASLFADPIRGSAVHWEALHTFNPAAVVRNGKIVVLYRAEDNTGTTSKWTRSFQWPIHSFIKSTLPASISW